MKQLQPFVLSCLLLAGTVAATTAPLCVQAQEEDTLRPLVVRPVDNSPPPPAESQAYAAQPLAGQEGTPQEIGGSEGLHLPAMPPQNPQQMNPPRMVRPVQAPLGRDVIAGFGPPSGSVVSDRVLQLRDESVALREAVNRNVDEFEELHGKGSAGAIQYHSTVAAITARLESGTTRGNPILLRQWNEAEESLNEVGYSLSKLNMLSSSLAGNSDTASYLLQAVRAAFELSGAVDEDHVQLALVRDEVARDAVQIDRTRDRINEDLRRQNAYLATERQNLQVLALAISRGELIHNSLANQPIVVNNDLLSSLPNANTDRSGFATLGSPAPTVYDSYQVPPLPAPAVPVEKNRLHERTSSRLPQKSISSQEGALPGGGAGLGQLLVLVRFTQDQVDYESQLYQAVSTALDRKPNAQFTVVAVSPKNGAPSAIGANTEKVQRDAENVKSSLLQLGLEPSRIATTSIASEVAQVPEVHVYMH